MKKVSFLLLLIYISCAQEISYTGERNHDGKYHGEGTVIYYNGDNYVGEYKDDKRHGQGTNAWPDGFKYVGGFKDNKKHGLGTFTNPDGRKYVGEFKDTKNGLVI